MSVTTTTGGRHFLQIPGPTNVPDRGAAGDVGCPTIDHRGPEFAGARPEVLEAVKPVFGTSSAGRHLPGVRHRRVGGGAGQHAVARATGAGLRDRALRHALAGDGHARWGCEVDVRARATGGTASTPQAAQRAAARPTPGTRSRPCASCTTRPPPASPAGSPRSGRPSTPPTTRPCCWSTPSPRWARIDYRHDEWGVDVTVAGSQKGLMLPPGLSFNAVSDKALRGVPDRRAAASRSGTGQPDPGGQRERLLALHPGHQPAVRPATRR